MSVTFGYARVSTHEQDIANQRLELERAGYVIQDAFWFADTGVSGSTKAAERPQFKALLDRIRPSETLVVSKLDRLGRDALDVGQTVKRLAERQIEVVVLQLGKLDLASPAGKMMLTMLAAVAEMERDLLIERTQAGLARAKAQGKTLGRPAKTTLGERARIIQARKQGASISALARQFGVARATILSILDAALNGVAAPAELESTDTAPKAVNGSRKAAAGT
jgi:DNA invertase Pin-like site-specific DNA recombinase